MQRLLQLSVALSATILFADGLRASQDNDTGLEPSQPGKGELTIREHKSRVMGTSLEITVLGYDPDRLEQAIAAAESEMNRIEDLMTDWRPSALTALNETAGGGPRPVPGELAVIISRGTEISRLTSGAFDMTYKAVGDLWNFKASSPEIPSPASIATALRNVGWDRINVSIVDNTVSIPKGMKIGLGGIAKGYGVDRAMAILMEHGVEHAIVNAGGDMKILGRKFGRPWEIAVKHPRDRRHAMASLKLSNTCLVTSGDYERFFEIDGKRYHHIIDPRTGYPSNGCLSASVVAPDAEFADALATALCVMSPQQGLELVETLRRVEAILVGMDGIVVASSGLKNAIRPK